MQLDIFLVPLHKKFFCFFKSYISPEIYLKEQYDEKSDIWSLGCVLFEMCTNELAFNGRSPLALQKAVCDGDPPKLPISFGDELQELLKK